MTVEGVAETMAKMNDLPGLLGQRLAGDACAAGARVVRNYAKIEITRRGLVKSGEMLRSVRVRRRTSVFATPQGRVKVPGGRAIVEVAALSKRGRRRPYPLFIEFGTENRSTRSGANRGRVMPTNFLHDALRRASPAAYEAFLRAATRGFDRLARDVAAGRGKLTQRLAGASRLGTGAATLRAGRGVGR